MKYLRLKFENACLKCDDTSSGYSSLLHIKESDWTSPIGIDQVSNMLHVMFGVPPVSSKRETIFKRNDVIYEMAKNSYIKYYDYDGNNIKSKYGLEFFQTAKTKFNSHSTIKEKIGELEVSGFYTWNYFERRFKGRDKTLLYEIMDFFNKVLDVDDVRKHYSFKEFLVEYWKHLSDECVQAFINNRLQYGGDFWGTNKPFNKLFVDLLRGENPVGSNGSYSGPTPLLLTRGVGRKLSLNGEIIVPIEDEYVTCLEEYGTIPTILDGGVISVISMTNNVDLNEVNDDFMHF